MKRTTLVIFCFSLAACTGNIDSSVDQEEPVYTQVIESQHGAVATAHPLATQAAVHGEFARATSVGGH